MSEAGTWTTPIPYTWIAGCPLYTLWCILTPMGAKVRTNIEIDEELIARAKRLYGLSTKREVVELALQRLVSAMSRKEVLSMEGSGWDGSLSGIRNDAVDDV